MTIPIPNPMPPAVARAGGSGRVDGGGPAGPDRVRHDRRRAAPAEAARARRVSPAGTLAAAASTLLAACTWWVTGHPRATDPLLSSGPARQSWILWPSGLVSSLGSAPVRGAVLAVALAALVAAGRWRQVGYVASVVAVVHLVDRVGKAFTGRARPLQVERGYALTPAVRVTVILAVLVAGAWLLRRRWRTAALLVAPAYLSVVVLDHLLAAVPVGAGADSYPSGHASNTMAIAAALILVRPPGRAWRGAPVAGMALVVAVGVSRVTLGFHHPSDVLAGWCLAAIIALAFRPFGRTRDPAPAGALDREAASRGVVGGALHSPAGPGPDRRALPLR